jgi:hypothetical protein
MAMPILAYCMLESYPGAPLALAGVCSLPVAVFDAGSVQVLYSEGEALAKLPTGSALELQKEALAFHDVISGIFAHQAVVPFRFPTLLLGLDELRDFVGSRSAAIRASLSRLRDLVQMEIRITAERESIASTNLSGADYLRSRKRVSDLCRQVVEQTRSSAASYLVDWRERAHDSSLRCYALVPRSSWRPAAERLREIQVPDGARVIVSGPWPPTEFVELGDQL